MDGYFFIIRRRGLFITYYNFLAFWGHSRDQFWVKKGPILLENNPKCSILALVVVFKEKFNGVTNFWQSTIFDLFGIPRIQWGLKMPQCLSISTPFRTKNPWCQCITLFDIISVLSKIFTMSSHLFITLRVGYKVTFLMLNCQRLRLKEFMIVRNLTSCYWEHKSSNWTCFSRYSNSCLNVGCKLW